MVVTKTHRNHEGHHLYRAIYGTVEPVPSVLHANSESREEAFKRYTLSFHGHNRKDNYDAGTVYVNFEKDTIFFPGSWADGSHSSTKQVWWASLTTSRSFQILHLVNFKVQSFGAYYQGLSILFKAFDRFGLMMISLLAGN